MSKENVKKFFGDLEKNQELREKLNAVLEKAAEETSSKIVALANAGGYTFTESDLMEFNSDMIEQANSNGKLSENDLKQAAGGGPISIMGSIITLGIACAVYSIYSEAAHGKGECSKFMKEY